MRDLFIVLTGRVFQLLTSLVALRLLTWRLDQVQMGRFSLLITVFTFFALVFVNPVGSYINRQLHSWARQGNGSRFLGYALLYLLGVCVLCGLILWLSGPALITLLDIKILWLIILIVAYLFTNTLNQTLIPSLNLLGKRFQWMLMTLLSLWVGLIASVLITGIEPSAEFWMYGQVIGFSVGALLALGMLLRALNSQHDGINRAADLHWNQLSPVIFFAIPLSVAVLLNWFQFQSFRFFFGEMESLARLGLFAAGYAISAGILGAFETTATQLFLPGFYRELDTSDRQGQIDAWRDYASLMIPMTLLFVVFVITMAEPLLKLLVDEKYWGGAHFVMIAAVLEASRVIGNAYAMAAHALKETRVLLIPQVLGALCVLVLVPGLLALAGETGFMAALVVASAVYLVAMRQVVNRITGAGLSFTIAVELIGGALLLVLVWIVSRWLMQDYLTSVLLVFTGLTICGLVLWLVRNRIIPGATLTK